ncbi:MAG: AAA family ATPase [Crenarchaeota archaeon]|nr:AAA family ATPase [Thermoproteota archaeon]
MSSELFDEIYLGRRKIIKNEEYLSPDKVPPRMPHREEELRKLARLFLPLVERPGSTYVTAVISGVQGIGKTHSVIYFYKHGLKRHMQEKHGKDVILAHVNAYKNTTLTSILAAVINNVLRIPQPARGLSPREQLDQIMKKLERKDAYMLLVLDDFQFALQKQGGSVANFFVRLYEDMENVNKRIHVIFIVRDFGELERHLTDEKAKLGLKSRHIHYKPYTSTQLYDILRDRAELALYDSAYDEEVLMEISRRVGYDTAHNHPDAGSARLAIEILYTAARKAEAEHKSQITLDDVNYTLTLLLGRGSDLMTLLERIKELDEHKLLLLLALFNLMKLYPEGVPIGRLELEYEELCELVGLRPRKHTQVYQYVRDMAEKGVVKRVVATVKNSKGRSSIIKVDYSPELVRKRVLELLRARGVNVAPLE